MAIQRIESLTYGVEDLDAGIQYYEDWGLEAVERGKTGAVFRTLENQFVHVRRADDTALPPSPHKDSTLREAIWGVSSAIALEDIGAELSQDRKVARSADGTLHAFDETGFGIGFRVANRTPYEPDAPPSNLSDRNVRLNRRVEGDQRARPIRIGHVVYAVPKQGWLEASAFYQDRLGFRVSDRSMDLGDFLRADGAYDHHNLGLFHAPNAARIGHVAFEVRSFDEIMFGGINMRNKGWKPVTHPGRRIVGSNLYWNFKNPCGGATEYFTDMDRMDDNWQMRVWDKHPGGDLWALDDTPAGA
jgi:catechol 2,3-dioxygenase-like lactoylglutathione lyase family enzyme